MLTYLKVKNLAVIEEATIELASGLNVVTGETGAGKSLVVDSLALLSGTRASQELIRTGADVLSVCGLFTPSGTLWRQRLAEAGIEAEGPELLVRREVSRTGRSRVFINDQPVTLRLLAEIAPQLIRIHGQREELGLATPDLQRRWLDRSGGGPAEELLERCRQAHGVYDELRQRHDHLLGNDRLRHERIDLLRFQIGEIEKTAIERGEEQSLRAERELLRNAELISGALHTSADLLLDDEGAAAERLARARHELEEIRAFKPEAVAWCEELEELKIRVEELGAAVRHDASDLEADPTRLDAVEDRLATLERLFRKYGSSSDEVLDHLERGRLELEELEGAEDLRQSIEKELEAAFEEYRRAALDLADGRRRWARTLAEQIRSQLRELALSRAQLSIDVDTQLPEEGAAAAPALSPHGCDRVAYLFSPNPGEELRSLAAIASGGELSRLYLAVQIAARGDSGRAEEPTLVFDEVDAGVGGAEAAAVGRKLKRLAAGGQVLAVTHLPQVASQGDVHFRVEKNVKRGRTHVAVRRLEPQHRVDEVARMLGGGEVTELSRSHAEELLSGAVG